MANRVRSGPAHLSTKLVLALLGFALVAAIVLVVWLRGRNEPSPIAGSTQTVQTNGLNVTMQLDDTAPGPRVIDVFFNDAAGEPVEVGNVRLRFRMVEMDMGVVEADAQPVSRGRFQVRGSFFTMAGHWAVEALVAREGQAPLSVAFTFPVAAPGETSGPLNPLANNAQTLSAGRLLYQANCAVCHGANGKGDGPAALGLNPRPGNFTQHMIPGKHTDGQAFLWIKDGFPNSAMPAWGQRFSEEQLWQLVTYLRTFAQPVAADPSAQATAASLLSQPTTQSVLEPLPPLVFTRQGNLWRSDGSGAAPRQLTRLPSGSYAEHPSFSPDGERIAFVTTTQGPITETTTLPLPLPTTTLSLMNADGSNLQVLWKPERGALSSPAWAPDGQTVYVSLYAVLSPLEAPVPDRLFQIVQVDPDSDARQVTMEDSYNLTFSRDGTKIAYLRWHKNLASFTLNVAAPDGSGEREVIGRSAFSDFVALRFSPDGRRIIFASTGGPPTDPRGYPLTAYDPSPLDRLLGLFAPPAAEAHGAALELWVVNTDGTGLRRLTHVREDTPMAVFSPDGRQIVLMGSGGIYLLNADGSNVRKIDPQGDHGGLDWGSK